MTKRTVNWLIGILPNIFYLVCVVTIAHAGTGLVEPVVVDRIVDDAHVVFLKACPTSTTESEWPAPGTADQYTPTLPTVLPLGFWLLSGNHLEGCDERERILPIIDVTYHPSTLTEGTWGYLWWSQHRHDRSARVLFTMDIRATQQIRTRIETKLETLRQKRSLMAFPAPAPAFATNPS